MPYPQDSRQWMLDELEGSGLPYEAGLVDGKAVLRSLEQYGDYRRPRGKKCYLFDGTDDWVDCSAANSLLEGGIQHLSLSCFVKAVVSKTAGLISKSYTQAVSQMSFNINGVNQYVFQLGNETTSGVTEVDGEWHHLAVTWDGVNGPIRMYFDGVEDLTTGSGSWVGTWDSNAQDNLALGRQWDLSNIILDGNMRNARVDNVTLTDSQILWLATEGKSGTNPGPATVGDWYCNEESGPTAYDSSGNGNDGVITNANLTTFHSVDDGVLSNPANDVGYTDNAGVIVPRDESNVNFDVTGSPLQFAGRCPLPAATQTPVGTFDGVDDYIVTSANIGISGSQPWSLSIRVDIESGWLANDTLIALGQTSANTLVAMQVRSVTAVAMNLWGPDNYDVEIGWDMTQVVTLLTATYDGTTIKLYANGIEKDSRDIALNITDSPIRMGGQPGGYDGQYFTGLLSDASVYGVTLTPDEVLFLFDGTGTAPTADPVGSWPITEGDGNTVYDVANAPGAGQNNGTITNANLTSFWAGRTDAARDHAVEYGGGRVGGFNGTDAKVQIPSPIITGTGDFSLAFRFKGVSGSLIATFAGANVSGLQVYVTTGLNCYIGGVVGGSTTVNDGEWYFGTVVRSGGTTTIYIDGAVDGSGAQAAAIGGAADMAFGARPDNLEWYTGNIADVRAYDDSLTPDEITFLQTSGNSGTDPTKDNLVGEWLLSGNAKDSSGNGNDGTEVGGVTYPFVPGLLDGSAAANGSPLTLLPNRFSNPKARINTDPWASPELAPINAETAYIEGNARQSVPPINTKFRASGLSGARHFTAANSEYFTIADNADLSVGGTDFAIALWVYFDSLTGGQYLFNKGLPAEYAINKNSGNKFELWVDVAGGNDLVTGTTSAVADAWYFIIGQYTNSTTTLELFVNAVSEGTSVVDNPPADQATALNLGRYVPGGLHLDGRLASVGFWKRNLTTDERTALYNAGEGLNSNQLSDALKTNLISYWNLDEPNGGDAQDLIGTNTLTAVNGPTSIAGPDQSTEGDDRMLAAWRTATQEDWGRTDGVDDYVQSTNAYYATGTVWRRAIYNATDGYDLDGVAGARYGRDPSGYPFWTNGGSDQSVTSIIIPNGVVHTLAMTSGSGPESLLYYNGQLIDSRATANGIVDNWIFGSESGAVHFSNADYIEYRIYDRVLTADEILWLNTDGWSGTDPTTANLKVYYDFSDQTGTTVSDVSGNGNDGTLNGDDGTNFWGSGLVDPPSLGLVGQDLQDVIAYVERQQLGPTFLPAWAKYSNTVLQSFAGSR